MDDLIARLEKATGPDRELDLAINVALWPNGDIAKVIGFRRGFDSSEGMTWDIHRESVCFQKHNAHGQCFYNGGYPLSAYTASIDAALTLVPPECWGEISWAGVLGPKENPHNWPIITLGPGEEGRETQARTIPLALCIASLKARALANKSARASA